MHLDLSPSIPAKAWEIMEALAQKRRVENGSVLWHEWVSRVDTETTAPIILQACAQVLASYGCVVSAIAFGAYSSQHYRFHGPVLSDDVAFHYLHSGIKAVKEDEAGLLKWLTATNEKLTQQSLENDFWIGACAAYLKHHASDAVRGATASFASLVVENAKRRNS